MTTAEIRKYRGYDILPQASTPLAPTCPYYRVLPCEPWHHERRKLWPRRSKG
jgi:hypothetical protein